MNQIQNKIQSLLFWRNEPMTISEIAKILEVSKDEVKEAAEGLKESIASSGIVLITEGDEMRLATSPENSQLIDGLEKAEKSKDLSKAALETLSIVLYRGPIKRSDIDYIRGVNSQFIVRHLEIRGLIEKEQSTSDSRVFMYKPTLDLLAHLGISNRSELPEYDSLVQRIDEAASSKEPEITEA